MLKNRYLNEDYMLKNIERTVNFTMNSVKDNKENMSAFLQELEEQQRAAEASHNMTHNRSYIINSIKDKQDEGTRNAAREVFVSIYRDALPLDKDYKTTYKRSLDNHLINYIAKETEGDVYDYLKQAGISGSAPAKEICDSVENGMACICKQYYENMDDVDPDEIDMGPESQNVLQVAQKVTSDMNADQVSEIIEANVKATIAKEIAATKEEDEKLAALEESLAADETVVSEDGLEMKLVDAGFKPNTVYKPSLFNAIMVGAIDKFSENGDEGVELQKKAFYESAQELTVLQTLQTLNILDINPGNVDKIAAKYYMH